MISKVIIVLYPQSKPTVDACSLCQLIALYLEPYIQSTDQELAYANFLGDKVSFLLRVRRGWEKGVGGGVEKLHFVDLLSNVPL